MSCLVYRCNLERKLDRKMKTRMLIVALVAVMAVSGIWLYKNSKGKKKDVVQTPSVQEPTKIPDYSGIQVKDVFTKDLRTGKGATVVETSKIKVSYEGWIYDPAALGNKGKQIFSKENYMSVPLDMKGDNVLMGFKKGLLGMKVGGLRQLVVPDHMAYGDKGFENLIPPKAIILFEIELLSAN